MMAIRRSQCSLLTYCMAVGPVVACEEGLHMATTSEAVNDLPAAVCSDCWWAWLIIWLQTMLGLIMDAVMIGIIFARISHPKYRGRTIAISDSAVISRRDGVLKFMFRIADFRRTQVGSVQIT
jgi:hypothetical protein